MLIDIYPGEKEAGKGGAFPARGEHCRRLLHLPRAIGRGGLHLLFCAGRSWTCAAAPSKLFLYPTELGKAVVDLDTKGNNVLPQ